MSGMSSSFYFFDEQTSFFYLPSKKVKASRVPGNYYFALQKVHFSGPPSLCHFERGLSCNYRDWILHTMLRYGTTHVHHRFIIAPRYTSRYLIANPKKNRTRSYSSSARVLSPNRISEIHKQGFLALYSASHENSPRSRDAKWR